MRIPQNLLTEKNPDGIKKNVVCITQASKTTSLKINRI
jgi:hypothetical protein